MEKSNIRRIRITAALFAITAFLLAVRLFYVQVICHDELKSAAVVQYEIPVIGLDTRGMITDRNSMPLTGGTKDCYYLIRKEKEDGELRRLMTENGARRVDTDSPDYLVYRTESRDEELGKLIEERYEAYIFETSSRYRGRQIACHLIGYINEDQGRGVSGLELMCEDRLTDDGSRLTIWADAAGNILRGLSPVTGKEYEESSAAQNDVMEERGVVTTIDRRLQYVCEESLADETGSGAALVMDGETGQILAWASLPVFDPNNVEDYLGEEGDCLINKVSQAAYAPGSVFKIVTAAAALESGVCGTDFKFTCEGETTVHGITMTCVTADGKGHGEIDMEEAMAVSCNCYFARLGEMTGVETILQTAEKMGLGQKVLDDFPEEAAGNLPSEDETGNWDTANISIGQGQLTATPLQIAAMTSVIAEGGVLKSPYVVMDDADDPENTKGKRIISEETARAIEKMLASVMKDGTGSGNRPLPVWGKTGTAQIGDYDDKKSNCWFTGYCRCGGRTYVITVVAENGVSGASTALPVFEKITGYIHRFGETS